MLMADCVDRAGFGRKDILANAEACVCGKREQDYGEPENSFGVIANLWTNYLQSRGIELLYDIEDYDVAAMMALLKIARISKSPDHIDSWIDLAGYAACGGELAT